MHVTMHVTCIHSYIHILAFIVVVDIEDLSMIKRIKIYALELTVSV